MDLDIKRIQWDSNLTADEIEGLILKNDLSDPLTRSIYVKLLMSYSWYELIRSFPPDQILDFLSDSVIKQIKSKALRERYQNARRLLSEAIVSSAR